MKTLLSTALAERLVTAALAATMVLALAGGVEAADEWREIKSAHFTLTSNASEASARTIAWQLEQMRSAIATLWPWAKVDLNRPLSVFVVPDETALKALAPMYWERKGSVRPATFWVAGVDKNYLAIRTDVEADDKVNINPYVSSYFSYVTLILQQSVARPMPLWFSRGLAGLLSNTIVRDSTVLVGAPIPWHLERLRARTRMDLPTLLRMSGSAPEFLKAEDLSTFDATSWALVHYLLFGERGVRWPRLDRFAQLVAQGTEPDAAFREALGSPDSLDGPFTTYINRSIFTFRQVNVDASVKREGFSVRELPAAEAAARQALLYTAMRRPEEARRAITEARAAGGAPDTFVAEGLLFDASGKQDEARDAYARAADAGSRNSYAHYRLASLMWQSQADRESLLQVDKILNQACVLNNRNAAAYALLADVRSALSSGDPMPMVLRAISLEPAEPHYRLTAASVLRKERKYDEALKHARIALSLADTEEERRRATEMIESLTRAKGEGGPVEAGTARFSQPAAR